MYLECLRKALDELEELFLSNANLEGYSVDGSQLEVGWKERDRGWVIIVEEIVTGTKTIGLCERHTWLEIETGFQ